MLEKIKVLEESHCWDVCFTFFKLVFSKFIDQKPLLKHAYEYYVEHQLVAFSINCICFQKLCTDADISVC